MPAGRATPAADSIAHLRSCDPKLSVVIDTVGKLPKLELGDPWWELVDSIASQQLSVKAASTIVGRVEALFGHRPTPAELVGADPEKLRGAGLSWAKVRYLQDLGQKVEEGEIELHKLGRLTDEEIIAELTAVKGIGRWTAEMFLIFHLGREDILPVDDLGLQEAVKRAYNLKERPQSDQLAKLAEPWRPYRSIATRYLWKSLNNTPLPGVEQSQLQT
jgi:DNA-3-methyladenine glycosylase II